MVVFIVLMIVCFVDVIIDCIDFIDFGNMGVVIGDDSCGSVVIILFFDSFVEDCSLVIGIFICIWMVINVCGLSIFCDQIIIIIDEMVFVFDFGCQEILIFIIEGGDFCLVDVIILLSEGDEFIVNDGWMVGGNVIVLLIGCVSDDCIVDDVFIIMVDDIIIVDDGICSCIIMLIFLVDDGCGNVFEFFVSIYIFIDDIVLVFDLVCQIDVIFIIEDGNVCFVDVIIFFNEGDVIIVNDSWMVGGVFILFLSGCVDDNCIVDDDFNIMVDDIIVVDDGICSCIIIVIFLVDDGCDNVFEFFVCNYIFIDNIGFEVSFNGILDMGIYVVECDLFFGIWDLFIEIVDFIIIDNCLDIDFVVIIVELI